MRRLKLLSSGTCLDGRKVSNDDLSKILETNHDWIVQRTGIVQRNISTLNAAELGATALKNAAEKTSLDLNEIDLIIVATYTSQNLMPNTANAIKKILNIGNNGPAFDINVACSGFVYAMEIASNMVQGGTYRKVAIIGTEVQSQHLDFSDRSTAILFGDGAGCMIFEATNENIGIQKSIIGSKIDYNSTLNLVKPMGNTPFSKFEQNETPYITMKGQEVFQFALITVKKVIQEILILNELDISDIDYFVLHQANWRIIDAIARSLKIEISKFPSAIEEIANTSAASIPIVFEQIENEARKNKTFLVVGFGAGLAYGATIIKT